MRSILVCEYEEDSKANQAMQRGAHIREPQVMFETRDRIRSKGGVTDNYKPSSRAVICG